MGDRCYLSMMIRKDQQHLLREAGFGGVVDGGDPMYPNAVKFIDDSANYALQDERTKLAELGAVFCGSHSSGDEYSAMAFVGYGGVMEEVLVDYSGALLGDVSFVDGHVALSKEAEKELLLYHELIDKVERELGAKVDDPVDFTLTDKGLTQRKFELFVSVELTAASLQSAYQQLVSAMRKAFAEDSYGVLEEYFEDDEAKTASLEEMMRVTAP